MTLDRYTYELREARRETFEAHRESHDSFACRNFPPPRFSFWWMSCGHGLPKEMVYRDNETGDEASFENSALGMKLAEAWKLERTARS